MKLALRTLCLVALTLTGCSNEASERQAFIDFMQQHIISRLGVHVVLMNPDLAKSFGRYASHYQVILEYSLNFNSSLDLQPLERVAQLKHEVSDLNDLAAHREELRTLRQAVPGMIASVEQKLAAANAARAALQQPPDLKRVYNQTFDRLITGPGILLEKMLTLLPSSLDAMIALGDYFADNAKVIRVQGMEGTSEDPVVDRHVKELVEAIHQNDSATDDLRRQYQALISGT